jgi:hypothetical protein
MKIKLFSRDFGAKADEGRIRNDYIYEKTSSYTKLGRNAMAKLKIKLLKIGKLF